VSAYFGRMKEGDYLSAKGPKVWPRCSFLISDTSPFLSAHLNVVWYKLWDLPMLRHWFCKWALGNCNLKKIWIWHGTLGFLEVFTGVLHCKLRFESLLRLLVQCVLKSWCVRCRGASITSPIKSGPLAWLQEELALPPCTRSAALLANLFKNVLHLVKEWILIVCFTLSDTSLFLSVEACLLPHKWEI
jgi:hypothetical protein